MRTLFGRRNLGHGLGSVRGGAFNGNSGVSCGFLDSRSGFDDGSGFDGRSLFLLGASGKSQSNHRSAENEFDVHQTNTPEKEWIES